jgi:hypothetical protein
MKFENDSKFGKIEGYLSELRPEGLIVEPSERIAIDSEIIILVLAIGISVLIEWKKFGGSKREGRTIPGSGLNLEKDFQQLEVTEVLEDVIIVSDSKLKVDTQESQRVIVLKGESIESSLKLEEDRQLLENFLALDLYMKESNEREQRMNKFYSTVFGND